MDAFQKLNLLGETGDKDDGDCINSTGNRKREGIVLTQVVKGNGKPVVLLKSLLTSICEHHCLYCPFRSGRDFPRTSFKPGEFAQLADDLSRAGLIQGVFLSSGVAEGGVATQDRLLATAEILRFKHNYQDYIHLKIMPGAKYEQVLRAMQIADRISINLEAPNARRLPRLAPEKDFEKQLITPLRWAHDIRQNIDPDAAWKKRWPSSCTQFVVGGSGESDRELLETAQDMHHSYDLLRVYFSAFQPHPDTPLENHPPTTYRRELRLYQADYLIRDYGFSQEELIFNQADNLPDEMDPKLAWAEKHLKHQPIEINTASRDMLLRIPGIGPKGANTIVLIRNEGGIRNISKLKNAGINIERMRNFVLVNGRRPIIQPVLI